MDELTTGAPREALFACVSGDARAVLSRLVDAILNPDRSTGDGRGPKRTIADVPPAEVAELHRRLNSALRLLRGPSLERDKRKLRAFHKNKKRRATLDDRRKFWETRV